MIHKLAKKRLQFFKRWQERARVLEQEGDSFLERALVHAKLILQGVWNEILKDLQYADGSLISDITNGFELTEWMQKTGIFASRARPAFGPETLRKLPKGFIPCNIEIDGSTARDDLEAGTWFETAEELSKGWVWDAATNL